MDIKTILLFLIIFGWSITAQAKKIPGYYIDNNGLRIEVVFKVNTMKNKGELDLAKLQHSIEYYKNDSLETLHPDDCKKYSFNFFDDTIEYLSVPDIYFYDTSIYPAYIFLRPKIIGTISVYYYYTGSSSTLYSPNSGWVKSSTIANGWILQNELGPHIFIRSGIGTKEDFKKIFFDWPELIERIENGKLDGHDMFKMVLAYNKWKVITMEPNEKLKTSN
jgi:hypothetical protein